MPKRRNATRRSLLAAGPAALLLANLARAEADAGDKITLQQGAKVEPEKYPWGSIRWLMSGKIDPKAEMTMGLVRFEPRQSNVLHIHPNSAEFLHALSGRSEHLIDGRWVLVQPGDTLRIPKNVPHQARTLDEPFEALIVYDTPNRIMVPVKDEAAGK